MKTADAVAVDYARVEHLVAEAIRPFAARRQICKRDLVGVGDGFIVQIDVDRKPFAGCMIAFHVQPDQMRNGATAEMPPQFIYRRRFAAILRRSKAIFYFTQIR